MNEAQIFEEIRKIVYQKFEKEYHCHLQYVLKVALELQKLHGGDLTVIKIAALAHDFGRTENGNNDNHPQLGAELIEPILKNLGLSAEKITKIQTCIAYDPAQKPPTIEAEIVYNADQSSKILYLPAFMLMVKKETFRDRANWALKYLNRLDRLTFPELKEQCLPEYRRQKQIYEDVLANF